MERDTRNPITAVDDRVQDIVELISEALREAIEEIPDANLLAFAKRFFAILADAPDASDVVHAEATFQEALGHRIWLKHAAAAKVALLPFGSKSEGYVNLNLRWDGPTATNILKFSSLQEAEIAARAIEAFIALEGRSSRMT